jgi:3-hydroxyisobutyrate dehydrogenase
VTENVAVVGLGAMGTPMARRLIAAGIQVSVFDVREDRIASLVEAGARGAMSPADAAGDAQAVVAMVATGPQLREAVLGEGGLAGVLRSGTPVIVTGTVGVEVVRDVEAELSAGGIPVVDAAVSGGVARAETGELLIMVGASTELLEGCRPVLEILGTDIVHCGERVGDGQAVKLVNQLLCGVHLTAAAEALAFAAALGLEPREVWDVLRRGAAASFMLEHRGPLMLAADADPTAGVLSLFAKDLDLVMDAAAKRGFWPMLSERAREVFRREVGLGREDDAALLEGFEGPPSPHAAPDVGALAQTAGLELSGDRVPELAEHLRSAVAEHEELRRVLRDDVAPHMAFDPRWD